MANCLLSFGANMGNPARTVHEAVQVLHSSLGHPTTFRCSRMFKTPPVGGPAGQPPFVNAVAAFETDLSPWQVWHAIRRVEAQFGRQRNQRWEARKLDLDILLYQQQRIWTPQLKIPHPRLCMRRFILQPACDVAAEWSHPVSQETIRQLADRLQTRPASLCLVSEDHSQAEVILSQVARLARADWKCTTTTDWQCPPPTESVTGARWVGLLASNGNRSGLAEAWRHCDASLLVYLKLLDGRSEAAWEDRTRELAARLNLCPDKRWPAWEITGPRYLLAADQPAWMIHELVAALEAMDCPVEPIT